MCATPKAYSPSLRVGPRVTFSSFGSLTFLLDCSNHKFKKKSQNQEELALPLIKKTKTKT